MSYLYGDSTPSQLELNYIEFLRDAMDLMVAVLRADYQSRTTEESGTATRANAEKELERLHDFSSALNAMLDGASAGLDPSSPTGQCASAVRNTAAETIRNAANQIKSSVQSQLSQLESQMKRDRAGCNSANEAFLLHHDLPGTVHRLELRSDGDLYRARLSGSSKEALSWVLDLEIPGDNLFASPVRLDRVTDHIEVSLPESSGWVRKTTKLRPQKLTNKYIVGLIHTANESTLKLRASLNDPIGYDIVINRGQVRVIRQGGDIANEVFEPTIEDAGNLMRLYNDVFAAASEISKKRVRLVDVRIDGKSLQDHDNPAVLVQRMVGRMAPTVSEIARRSQSPSELVLKRVLADHRREEIFVSKAELMRKLDAIPLSLRGIFAPLGLGDLESGYKPPSPVRRNPNTTVPPAPAPRAFRKTLPPPVSDSDDIETKVSVSSAANGKISLHQGPPPTPRAARDGDDTIDTTLASLETDTGS